MRTMLKCSMLPICLQGSLQMARSTTLIGREVYQHVTVQMTFLGRFVRTNAAGIRFFSCVSSDMRIIISFDAGRVRTERTLSSLRFTDAAAGSAV